MYKSILVPYGGTTAGDEALKHAIHLAKNNSARILLLHVVESIPLPSTFALAESERKKIFDDIQNAHNSLKASMEEEMDKKILECKNNGIDASQIVVIGNPAEEILKIVQEKNIDLVVMAKRRKLKGIKKLLSLGSVSRKVVEHVTCPVYLIDIEDVS